MRICRKSESLLFKFRDFPIYGQAYGWRHSVLQTHFLVSIWYLAEITLHCFSVLNDELASVVR